KKKKKKKTKKKKKKQPVIKNELMEWDDVLLSSSEKAMSCLLVGNYPNMDFWDSNDKKKKEHIMQMHEYLHEWCVDHNYEFVPSPHIPSDNNSNSNSNNVWKDILSSYSAEELGSQRVFDALQCVNWPVMIMAPRKTGAASRSLRQKKTTTTTVKYYTSQTLYITFEMTMRIVEQYLFVMYVWFVCYCCCCEEEKHASVVIKEKPESKTQDNVDKILDDDHMSAEEDDENDDKDSPKDNGLIHQFAKMWSDEKVKYESTNEAKDAKRPNNVEWDMQAFESLVEEMKNVRQASLNGNLSYEDRKKTAAETAMKLYHYMGLNGLEDELSEEETVDID
ncbi:hypothetical protein RFI_19575, partial [Reticulomyxa filosa]